MEKNQTERAYEEKRLKKTIFLAGEQLKQVEQAAEKKKAEIFELKKEARENTVHSITGLHTSDGFEALVELSQYINPVTDKLADYEEEEHKIVLLQNMIKSPYFARIDFKFDDEEEFEKDDFDDLTYLPEPTTDSIAEKQGETKDDIEENTDETKRSVMPVLFAISAIGVIILALLYFIIKKKTMYKE